jgi:hypothetical protein
MFFFIEHSSEIILIHIGSNDTIKSISGVKIIDGGLLLYWIIVCGSG